VKFKYCGDGHASGQGDHCPKEQFQGNKGQGFAELVEGG
jgi:hypothetical protein